ncbi:sensor histidine kinase [Paenibacillus alkaliterrae]|uniref:sensor histidine kinase n=1 Tax=Paenibacillus alkaliterrae TaxID=320909 RepID=UPI001F417553|nr:sensor histidine kinase [Paenibacillus alkaliterrae]MCF2941561.1 sensor histidine kinase [Paenibacillus alkaliterrae]
MKSSLRKKLMIVLLAATVLPISISMLITYNRTTASITEQAVKDNSKLLFQGKTNLINYFELFNKLFNSVYYDQNAGDALFRLLRDGVSTPSDNNTERTVVGSTLRGMAMTSPDIFQIRLQFNDGNRTFLLANDLLRYETNVKSPEDDTVIWRPSGYIQFSHSSHPYGINKKKFTYYFPKTVVTFHRPILDVPSDREIGRLSIDITLDYIRSISEMLYTPDVEELWIVNENGDVVFSSDEEKIGAAALQDTWVDQVLNEGSERGQFRLQSQTFDGIVVYEKLTTNYMNWTIVKRIPYDHLYSGARQITRINSLVLGCFLLITVVATMYISYRITKPIKRLIHSIHVMQTGNLQVDIPIESQDEIGILARRFRQLMDQINHLILREYRLEIANKSNQLKALQAQIHPHFLNNALQSIGTLALKHQDRKVYTLISSLGKLMRYHMNTEETIVPLIKEVDHVKAYAELQKQRFGDNLDIHFVIESGIEHIELPKMIIQPLVENVFKHGVKRSDVPIEIVVRCWISTEGALQISVEDNGRGIELERMSMLQKQLDLPESAVSISKEEHIGLTNVLMRLRLFFNKHASMTLKENVNGGFIVMISIPMKEGEYAT